MARRIGAKVYALPEDIVEVTNLIKIQINRVGQLE